MLTNKYTLDQLRTLTAGEVDEIPLDQMAELLEAVSKMRADVKTLDAKLTASMMRRYDRPAHERRRQEGKNTGTVTLYDGDYAIKADLPKKITWDTPQLQQAWYQLQEMGEDPSEIIEVKLSVPERRFAAMTSRMQAVLIPARTEGVANPSFVVERRSDEDV
jgi:hypothetical protein